MGYNYKAYGQADVKNVYPGYAQDAWLAPRSAFTILQEPAPGGAPAQGDTLIIALAHTFPAAEGFVKIYCAPETTEAPGALIGPVGAKRARWNPKIFIPGDSPQLLEQVLAMVNDDMILIVKDANCPGGQLIQFGCDCTPSNASEGAYQAANVADESGRKGWEITFRSYCKYYYNATITLKPAV